MTKHQRVFPKFAIDKDSLTLEHTTQPDKFCEATGRKAALLGFERGSFEAWIYPFKICHDIELEFIVESKKWVLKGSDLARVTQVRPEYTSILYSHEGFTIRQILFVPLNEAGGMMLLDVDSFWDIKIAVKFRPDLQPMWPAGLGGQYTLWNEDHRAYLISEGSRRFHGLIGSPFAQNISLTPGHHLPDAPMEFILVVDPLLLQKSFIPIIFTGGEGERQKWFEIYNQLAENIEEKYIETVQHYRRLETDFMTLRTPDNQVNRAFAWAKVALDKGMVDAPGIGKGLVAGYAVSGLSNRPGFAWFFGGDTFLNSLAFNSFGDFENIRQALALFAQYQREDGKIFHEFSLSGKLINWFEKYPYGYYHAETTPYYIVAMHDYWRQSGDDAFIRESRDSIKRAYEFCLAADTDGDGLMENSSAGLAAMEVGALSSGIKIDIYLASIWLKAIQCMIDLAELLEETDLKQSCENLLPRARESFISIFYDAANQTLRFAELKNGDFADDVTAWHGVPLAFELVDDLNLDGLLRAFDSPEMCTAWGARLLSKASAFYDPVNYNCGSVWPFVNGYVALAEYRLHRPGAAFRHLMGNVYSSEADALGFHTELLSGEYFRAISSSVPHQLFSSSQVITPLVRGLLGLNGDARRRIISLAPQMPSNWERVEFSNYRVEPAAFDCELSMKAGCYDMKMKTHQAEQFHIYFAPAFAPGTEIIDVLINGKNMQFSSSVKENCVICNVDMQCLPEFEIEIHLKRAIENFPELEMPVIGQRA
ncbi:hypothetical protein JXJ21_07715 [candidate division KSB1 bacterium]|nr:hypothetical protein [candidate division KSB1 bacterium]